MTNKLNTENIESLIYENALLTQTVLGGIKLEGLDRMRVTLKVALIDSSRPPIRHNLDLYNDSQCEKLIRRIAERLEIGTHVIAASISELIEALENYRLAEIKRTLSADKTKKILSPKEVQAAQENLQTPNLLDNTLKDLQNTGIQGEENNALILLLAMTPIVLV